ncbi:hypothetical protein ASPWEDRAFT_174362 [Aspergillus wentii DTO 134E9]|uniref:Tubby C-terminal domain-containing protein n=1 Tax=Aspergillus wentii DTO 134E9 TaxID=1073089 RepID=A0A1L9RDC4_ASPWE|nr:uncharacterized protein ASPWEDRAFT_174362 [Aspergillus wentii DTO 134E9]KAI9933203.1 hypothetical protein MW887_007675 [Aspergillus wentii]OJJ32930.1 hypothetical protein ASPWEDRAFT_174362 [Aspergillus wentii DTO 134E9]
MAGKLLNLQQAIAIHPQHVPSEATTIYIKHHSRSASRGDFTVSTCPHKLTTPETKLFSMASILASWRQRRSVRDASDQPLYDLRREATGVTWSAYLPGQEEHPVVTIAPRLSWLKDKMDVYVKNAAGDGQEVLLEVRGQDVWKIMTHVFVDGALVMVIRRLDFMSAYIPVKGFEWKIEVAGGLDLSLVLLIISVMADIMYYSSPESSYKGSNQQDN